MSRKMPETGTTAVVLYRILEKQVSGHLRLMSILLRQWNMLLNEGKSRLTGEKMGLDAKPVTEFSSYQELQDATF